MGKVPQKTAWKLALETWIFLALALILAKIYPSPAGTDLARSKPREELRDSYENARTIDLHTQLFGNRYEGHQPSGRKKCFAR